MQEFQACHRFQGWSSPENTLRIQICPKEGMKPRILVLGGDWILRDRYDFFFFFATPVLGNTLKSEGLVKYHVWIA